MSSRLISAAQGFGSYVLSRHFDERSLIGIALGGEPGTLVDVGAASGMYAVYFGSRGWDVHAFEPEPGNFRRLQARTESLDSVACYQKALGREQGEEVLHVSDEHPGIHSLKRFHPTHTSTVTVEVSTLAAELARCNLREVTVLKIDVEGAELPVLEGLDFSRVRPRIVIAEFMDDRSRRYFNYGAEELREYVESHGYTTVVSEWAEFADYGADRTEPSPHRWLGLTMAPSMEECAWGNFLFLRDQKDVERIGTTPLRWQLLGWTAFRFVGRGLLRITGFASLHRSLREGGLSLASRRGPGEHV